MFLIDLVVNKVTAVVYVVVVVVVFAASHHGEYVELKSRLENSLPQLEHRLNTCPTTIQPGQQPDHELETMKNLTQDVSLQSSLLKAYLSFFD